MEAIDQSVSLTDRSSTMRAAVVQLRSTSDQQANLAAADRLTREAAAAGARVVLLPEKWSLLGNPRDVVAAAEGLDGAAVSWARATAAELGVDLLAGSVALRRADGRIANTALHVAPDGRLAAAYGKLHLFDADVAGTRYRESADEDAGDRSVVSALADDGATGVGLTVCYDLRFPELHRALALDGARILAVPAAFTARTTADHWEILLRARAIENGVFVLAANQHGEHAPRMRSGGRSMIVDPWGAVLARLEEEGDGVAVADLDLAAQDDVREQLPVLRQRRADVAAALAGRPDGDLASAWRRVPPPEEDPR